MVIAGPKSRPAPDHGLAAWIGTTGAPHHRVPFAVARAPDDGVGLGVARRGDASGGPRGRAIVAAAPRAPDDVAEQADGRLQRIAPDRARRPRHHLGRESGTAE